MAEAPDDKYSIYDFSNGPTERGLRLGHWNVQGLGLASNETKKLSYVECLINWHCFHIFALAETMLREGIRGTRTAIEGFGCERLDREMKCDGTREKASGGIMVYIHKGLKYEKIEGGEKDGNLQYMIVRVSKPVQVDIVVVYNPPNGSHVERFASYLNFAIEKLHSEHPVVLLGDINIDQLDLKNNKKYPQKHVAAIERALTHLNLEQQVNHRITRMQSKAILDHIYMSPDLISECDVMRIHASDHDIVYCVLIGTEFELDIKKRQDFYEKSLKGSDTKKKTDRDVRKLLYVAQRWAELTKRHAREIDELSAELKAFSLR